MTIPVKRVPFDSLTMNAVSIELNRQLSGGQIQDVRQPFSTQLVLSVRNRDKTNHLLIDSSAQFARVHITARRRSNVPTPPSFCMAVRRTMENRRIASVEQQGFDRILHITTSSAEEPPNVLIVEVMGKHSNIILVDESGRIIDAAQRVTHRINRFREVLPGGQYVPPPLQEDRVSPLVDGAQRHILREIGESHLSDADAIASALQQIYEGMSPFLAAEIAERALRAHDINQGMTDAWAAVFHRTIAGNYSPVLYRDTDGVPVGAYPFEVVRLESLQKENAPSLSLALDECWSVAAQRSHLIGIRSSLNSELQQALRQAKHQMEACTRGLLEASQADSLRQRAELIKANLWRAEPGMTSMIVEDYWDPELKLVEIQLGGGRSALEEIDHLFNRSRKARQAQEREGERRDLLVTRIESLQNAMQELQTLATDGAIDELRKELRSSSLLPRSEVSTSHKAGESEWAGHKIRRYHTPEGYEVLVGETSTANDYLTTRVAHANDIWLHVRAAPSAHTIIRTHGKPDQVPRSVLLYAAQVCARHSANKHSALVSVDYTIKRYVRKPRGSAPGAADYIKEITLDVSPGLDE